MKKEIITITFLLLGIVILEAQCKIPNGNFDNWKVIDNGTDIEGNPRIYDFPEDWVESVVNVFFRTGNNHGFFYKYSGSDANNSAVILRKANTNKNNGFIRFKCNSVPYKLKGRYKFSGSSSSAITDTLRIIAHFSKTKDTLPIKKFHFFKKDSYPTHAKIFKTIVPKANFTDFEIDLEAYATSGIDYDYAVIQFVIDSDYYLKQAQSITVIDDLHFEYDTGLNIEENNSINDINIYPSITKDNVYINKRSGIKISSIQVFDFSNRFILESKTNNKDVKKINLSRLANGPYIMKFLTDKGTYFTKKVIKK
ncbi:T9SS type A sorting domain-containing protein [Flavivirga eckloniae]|uniref:Secretion system C-terminal sorting domain-containing protein n=1 Tax=Flavivirga eckloniae TaxID=1803846 RepID=A0A2K9PMC4_9FLAO|nr:T9SS type A sorting domain-containing protein [Flavivirga eckloniae]AUP78200.1 hypothetical protein C1H87_05500 [Flavivirga eckloniae]